MKSSKQQAKKKPAQAKTKPAQAKKKPAGKQVRKKPTGKQVQKKPAGKQVQKKPSATQDVQFHARSAAGADQDVDWQYSPEALSRVARDMRDYMVAAMIMDEWWELKRWNDQWHVSSPTLRRCTVC